MIRRKVTKSISETITINIEEVIDILKSNLNITGNGWQLSIRDNEGNGYPTHIALYKTTTEI